MKEYLETLWQLAFMKFMYQYFQKKSYLRYGISYKTQDNKPFEDFQ